MNPVDLILDRPHCFFLIEEADLVGLGLVDQKSGFVDIIDDVLGERPLLRDHIELQIGSPHEHKQLEILIEITGHVPLGAALREDPQSQLQLGLFEPLHVGLRQREVEDPQFDFSELGRVVGDFDVDAARDLAGVVDDVAGDAMRCPRMVEKRIDIVSTVPNHVLPLLQLKHQSRGVLRHFNQKNLVNRCSRRRGCGTAFGDLPQRHVAGKRGLDFRSAEIFDEDVEVPLEVRLRLGGLHVQIICLLASHKHNTIVERQYGTASGSPQRVDLTF